ncbi:Sister chromatid cohesion protein 2 [Gryganskiella cystojenkinii]|nr:Sister chromatid cohesion protein 2 [Gryganskiella cystojenkinii]
MTDPVEFPFQQDPLHQQHQQLAPLPPIQVQTTSSFPIPSPLSMPAPVHPGMTVSVPMSAPMANHSQGQVPMNFSNGMTLGPETLYGPDITTTATTHHLPTTAQAGLQYCALASITSTDSVLRDLPSLAVAFPEFKLVQPRDPAIRSILAQEGLSQHASNFETQYLKTIIANANVDNIRFQEATQITASQESFTPQFDFPLSTLSETVLKHCSEPQSHSGNAHQLPKIDPYDTLIQFRQDMAARRLGSNSSSLSSAPSSRKRSTCDSTDEEHEKRVKAPKKIKSRSAASSAADSTQTTTVSRTIQPKQRQSSPVKAGPTAPVPIALRPPQVAQEHDPALEFEDIVSEFMERLNGDNSSQEETQGFLSVAELKHLERSVDNLSVRGLIAEVQVDTKATLLRYLDRSMNHFESLEYFPQEGQEGTDNNSSVAASTDPSVMLEQILLSLQHASLSFVILNAKGLEQHLFPEELLLTSLSVFKARLEKFLAPALESSKESSGLDPRTAVFKTIAATGSLKAQMLSMVRITCDIAERLRVSGNAELSDSIIVKFVYIALSLFFIDTSSEMIVGLTEAESLKQAGSSLMRMLFAKHKAQRAWILEDTLSSLIKLPHGKKVVKSYRLTDGSRIHASSALLMQLVHMCAEHTINLSLPVDLQDLPQSTQKIELQKLLDSVRPVMEDSKANIAHIFNYLLSRCTKATKSSLDADYRAVLDALLNDLLVVLGQPEWPSAELYLFLFSKAMARILDDSSSDLASRIMAVDYLGLVAAKIKTISNGLENAAAETVNDAKVKTRPYYGELSSLTKLSDVEYLQASYSTTIGYLGSHEINDSALRSAKNSWIVQWLATICSAATKDIKDGQWKDQCWNTLISDALGSWKTLQSQDRNPRSSTSVARSSVLGSAAYLTSRQSLFLSFDMLLSRILVTLEGGAITLRAKSLKALSLVVIGDYGVLAQQNVRKTIAFRLQDQSSSVRDAAVEMVGKYMVQDPKIRKAYYDIVTDRISDTGLNVRKRVIRLLRDMFYVSDNVATKNNISQKLLLRVNDDENSVRELALKSVSEVIFGQFISATAGSPLDREESQRSSHDVSVGSSQKREVSKYTRTLVDMVGQLSAQQDEAFGSVISNLLKKERGHNGFNPTANTQDFGRTCVVIVDCLVDLVQTLQDEDAPKAAVTSTVHTLFTFIKAEPRLIDAKHLGSLLVYLHCSETSDDWRITMFVLRIFQSAVPVVKDVPTMDAQTAERLSLALVAKCPVVLLPEAVSVLCLVVRLLSVHSGRICKFFLTCIKLLRDDAERLRKKQVIQEHKTRRLVTIVGLLCQHFPFSMAIVESPDETHLTDLKAAMEPTTEENVFHLLASLCNDDNSRAIQQSALQSLGFLFLSFPSLMTSLASHRIMDSVFAGEDIGMKVELLTVYTNFLLKIHTTPAMNNENSTGNSLIARAEDHMDAGVASAIMQQYLDRVLRCALQDNRDLQAAAVNVIGQVTSQALVHPVLCMPVAVALEGSEDPALSGRAFKIHRELHEKHASLIYAKSSECVRTLYMYRHGLLGATSDTPGYRVMPESNQAVALLDTMYSLAGDKRQTRNALLSGLVKVLDVDLTVPDVQVDGDYARFIAENLAYLQYRTMEEVYLVIFYLNRIIASTGTTLLESLLEMSSGPATLSGGGGNRASTKTSQQQASLNGRKNGVTKGTRIVISKKTKAQKSRTALDGESGEDIPESMMSGEDAPDSDIGHGRRSNATSSSTTTIAEDDREPILPVSVMAKASVAVEAAIVLKSYLKRNYDVSETKAQQFQLSASKTHKEKPQARYKGPAARLHWQWKANEVGLLCGAASSSVSSSVTLRDGSVPKSGGEAMMKWQLARFRELIEAETVQRIREEDLVHPSSENRIGRRRRSSSGSAATTKAIHAASARKTQTTTEEESLEEDDQEEDDDDDDDDEEDGDQSDALS